MDVVTIAHKKDQDSAKKDIEALKQQVLNAEKALQQMEQGYQKTLNDLQIIKKSIQDQLSRFPPPVPL
eukprot:706999-Karenia_brevis.AAC.1